MAECNHSRWRPSHDYRPLESRAEKQAWLVVALTGVTMLVEIAAGYLFNSMALLADGWHMASHMLAIGLAAIAYWLARRYAGDPRFTFGTWKIEILAGFASAMMLLGVVVLMAFESLWRLWRPEPVAFEMALWVACIGLVVNLISAWLLRDTHEHHGHDHDHDHDHDAGRDLNRHAAFLHVLADALTSVAALVALAGGLWLGWAWLDPLMGVLGSLIIAWWARGLLIQTGRILLDREMDAPLLERLRGRIERKGDSQLTDLHLWRVGRAQYAAIISLVTHGDASPDDYKRQLAEFSELVHLTVEVNRCPAQDALSDRAEAEL